MAIFDGNRVRVLRQTRGMTAGELASQVGVSQNMIYGYERGKRPSLRAAEKVAKALNVPFVDLLLPEARRGSIYGRYRGDERSGSDGGSDEGTCGYKGAVEDLIGAADDSPAAERSVFAVEIGDGIYASERDRPQEVCPPVGERSGSEPGPRRAEQDIQLGGVEAQKYIEADPIISNVIMSEEERRAIKDKLLQFALSINAVQDEQRRAHCLEAAQLLLRVF